MSGGGGETGNPDCVRCSGGSPNFCACTEPCLFPTCNARMLKDQLAAETSGRDRWREQERLRRVGVLGAHLNDDFESLVDNPEQALNRDRALVLMLNAWQIGHDTPHAHSPTPPGARPVLRAITRLRDETGPQQGPIRQGDLDLLSEAVAVLNDLVMELVDGTSKNEVFKRLVREQLTHHSATLGYTLQGPA